jgi:hypothetical protein
MIAFGGGLLLPLLLQAPAPKTKSGTISAATHRRHKR